jgi:hypothetical protein
MCSLMHREYAAYRNVARGSVFALHSAPPQKSKGE